MSDPVIEHCRCSVVDYLHYHVYRSPEEVFITPEFAGPDWMPPVYRTPQRSWWQRFRARFGPSRSGCRWWPTP